MEEQNSGLLWEQSDWRASARAWILAQLDRLGIEPSGDITQPHIRPWSTVLHVPTATGMLYFKATAAECLSETALTVHLAQTRPDCTVRVLASDMSRGWLLMTHGGDRLRTLLKETQDITHWHPALRTYANLQIEQSNHLSELLSTGTPDHRLERLPSLYAELLSEPAALDIDQPDSLTGEEYEQLRAFTPEFSLMCKRLAAFGIPETLQHDDLHDGNIFVHEGRTIPFDWGDSSISHPFFTLLVTLRSAKNTLGLEQDDPALLDLRSVYLEVWSRYGSRENLDAALDLALQIGMVCRALTWHRLIVGMTGPARQQYAGQVGGWLQEFHHAAAVGR